MCETTHSNMKKMTSWYAFMRFQESWYSYKGFLVTLDDVFFYDHTLKKSTENRVQAFIKNTSGSLKYCIILYHSLAEVRPSYRPWK